MVIKPYTISFLDNMMQTFYVMKQNNREYTFSLCCSISGIEETIVSLFSTVSWLQMRWQCSLYPQLLLGLLFSSSHSDVSLRSRWISLAERGREREKRDQPLYHSHIICTHYSCTWQHNYQSSGPVQLKASGCWQTGVWVKGTWQRWVKISAKVFEDSNCPSVLTMLTVIEDGSWITRKSFTILATDVSCQTI